MWERSPKTWEDIFTRGKRMQVADDRHITIYFRVLTFFLRGVDDRLLGWPGRLPAMKWQA